MGLARSIRKAPAIRKLRRLAVYAVSLAAVRLVAQIRWPAIVRIGRMLGRFTFRVVRYGRGRTIRNLTRVFGAEKGPEEIRRIACGAYEHLAVTALEFPKMREMDDAEFFARCEYDRDEVEGVRRLMAARRRGIIFASAHMGNWEMLATYGARLNFTMSVLYKPPTNPYLDRLWQRFRGENKLIDITKDLSTVIRRLRKNEVICLLFDENAKRRGVPLEFFGRPASTYAGPAYFALRTGCPIVCLYFIRTREWKHRFVIERIIIPPRGGDRERDTLRILREMNSSLEAMIRRYPDQWNWIYERWGDRSYVETPVPGRAKEGSS